MLPTKCLSYPSHHLGPQPVNAREMFMGTSFRRGLHFNYIRPTQHTSHDHNGMYIIYERTEHSVSSDSLATAALAAAAAAIGSSADT
mmetsp:Transcript_36493/g.81249  ORF Transcript_36493/g.81249 Transcript_36493/m.81249 type:complete len:87 (+) Transcript_36493:180-440(+)